MPDCDYQILSARQTQEWEHALAEMPTEYQDPFYRPGYYLAFENLDQSKARCFVYREGKDVAFYPFLQRSLARLGYGGDLAKCHDIQSAYGYGGPATNCKNSDFLERFRRRFGQICREERIICEFVRCHPLLNNHGYLKSDCKLVPQNVYVAVDLNKTEEAFWKSYNRNVRKNINKALREGVKVEVVRGGLGSQVSDFQAIYQETMERNDADDFYWFSNDFFSNLCCALPDEMISVYARIGSEIVSCELVLCSSHIAYSYLGGTRAEFNASRPNTLIKHEIILDSQRSGRKWFLMGGGLTENDGVFLYKKNFAPQGLFNFHIGLRVHDEGAYQNVCTEWERRNPEKAGMYSKYLQRYWL